jgi:predicted deacylase
MNSHITINIEDFDLDRLEEYGSKQTYQLKFDRGLRNEGIIPVNLIKGEEKGKTLVVFAGVHGDEYEGIQTIIQIYRHLLPTEIHGTLVMIPVANVSAYYAGTRTSKVDGKNLARSFPGNPEGEYTSRLAWYLQKTFISKADFLLDLHSGGTHYAMPPMVGYYYDSDSEIGRKSKAAAIAFGMEVIWGHDNVGLGRTISSAMDYSVPWLYTEGYGGKRIKREEQRLYEHGVYRLLKHMDMLLNVDKYISGPQKNIVHRVMGDGNLDKAVTAETDGFFIPKVKLLDKINSRDTIGILYNWYGEQLQVVKTNQSGIVMMLREIPYTNKGDGLYAVAYIETFSKIMRR